MTAVQGEVGAREGGRVEGRGRGVGVCPSIRPPGCNRPLAPDATRRPVADRPRSGGERLPAARVPPQEEEKGEDMKWKVEQKKIKKKEAEEESQSCDSKRWRESACP